MQRPCNLVDMDGEEPGDVESLLDRQELAVGVIVDLDLALGSILS